MSAPSKPQSPHLHTGGRGICALTWHRAMDPDVPSVLALCPRVCLCPQEPAFGMLTVPLRMPLTGLPVEHHAEAVSIFKLVRAFPGPPWNPWFLRLRPARGLSSS